MARGTTRASQLSIGQARELCSALACSFVRSFARSYIRARNRSTTAQPRETTPSHWVDLTLRRDFERAADPALPITGRDRSSHPPEADAFRAAEISGAHADLTFRRMSPSATDRVEITDIRGLPPR